MGTAEDAASVGEGRRKALGPLATLARTALADTSAAELLAAATRALATGLGVPCVVFLEPDGGGRLQAAGGTPIEGHDLILPGPGFVEGGAVGTADSVRQLAAGETDGIRLGTAAAAGLVAPYRTADDRRGLLIAATGTGRRFTGADRMLVADVAALISAGLANRAERERLRDKERRLEDAQRLAHLGSYDWHIATDTNAWSDELYRIYGCEPQAFNASYERFLEFIHPDDREHVQAVHQRAFETGEPYEMEERIVRPDGEERILASTGQVICDEHGTPVRFAGICFDVTEQRRAQQFHDRLQTAEQDRRQALEINDNVVQGLTAALWALRAGDLAQAEAATEGTLRSARELVAGLLDRHPTTLGPGDLRRDQPAPSVLERGAAAAVKPERLPEHGGGGAEAPARPPLRVLVADDADDIRLVLQLTLTARLGCEIVAEAATGREAIEAAAATQPDLALVDLAMPELDGLEAIPSILAASPATRVVVLSGFSAAEMRGRADAAGAHAYVEKGATADELVGVITDLIPGVEVRPPAAPPQVGPAAGTGDAPVGVDLSLLSHELRTPITVLLGLASTLRAQIDAMPSAAVREVLERLERNARGLDGILGNLDDGRRVAAGVFEVHAEPTDLAALVRQALGELRSVTDQHPVEVHSPSRCVLEGDPHYLRTMVRNLVGNAGKFSPSGTPIDVHVVASDRGVTVAVTDRGPGIPADRRHELFRPFHRLADGGPGLGLGLAIARGVAEAHGGTLELDEEHAGGSRFVATLPRSRVDAAVSPER